jgi:hypothetical protein
MGTIVAAVLLLLVAVVLALGPRTPMQQTQQLSGSRSSIEAQSRGNGAAAFVAFLAVLLVMVAMSLQLIH